MKKLFSLVLVCAMVLSVLSACGSSGTASTSEAESSLTPESSVVETIESEPEEIVLNVGDTAEGTICSITLTSAEFVNKIENGLVFHMWSPAEQTNYQDVFAEDGYSIIKLSYHIDYKGKEAGRFTLGIELDYDDGYTFTTAANHVVPPTENGVGFSKSYAFLTDNSFNVDDPLTYKGEDITAYIVVNDVVLTETDKPCVLNLGLPTAPDTLIPNSIGGYDYQASDAETFTFDLRSVEFDLSTKTSAEETASEETAEPQRFEKTGKLIGPNNGLQSLNKIYGNNSWSVKYGDNPVRETVFFREDIDLNPYIGKEITFSFIYDDKYPIDAYIVE